MPRIVAAGGGGACVPTKTAATLWATSTGDAYRVSGGVFGVREFEAIRAMDDTKLQSLLFFRPNKCVNVSDAEDEFNRGSALL